MSDVKEFKVGQVWCDRDGAACLPPGWPYAAPAEMPTHNSSGQAITPIAGKRKLSTQLRAALTAVRDPMQHQYDTLRAERENLDSQIAELAGELKTLDEILAERAP